ncbi:MAG: hypothetical protein Q7K43_03750 [Candidatus Woesearchaeota archaeon]|nr:hypothetical protein [Candidatus Woesearchaeota archaeon]
MKASAEPTMYAVFVLALTAMIIILGMTRTESYLHSAGQEQHYLANRQAALISTLSLLSSDVSAVIIDQPKLNMKSSTEQTNKKYSTEISQARVKLSGISEPVIVPIITSPTISIKTELFQTQDLTYTKTPIEIKIQPSSIIALNQNTPTNLPKLLSCPEFTAKLETIGLDPGKGYDAKSTFPGNKGQEITGNTESHITRVIAAALITTIQTTIGWKATRELRAYTPGIIFQPNDPELSQTTQQRKNALTGQDLLISIQTGIMPNTVLAYVPKSSQQSTALACKLLNSIASNLMTQSVAIIPLDIQLLPLESFAQILNSNQLSILFEIGTLGDTLTAQPELLGATLGKALVEATHAK